MHEELRLRKGQTTLTPAQVAEARRFVQECIQAQVSTKRVDEQKAEDWLRRAYKMAGLVPPHPRRIHWVDGPFELMLALLPERVWYVRAGETEWLYLLDGSTTTRRASSFVAQEVTSRMSDHMTDRVWEEVQARVRGRVLESLWESVRVNVEAQIQASLADRLIARLQAGLETHVWERIEARMQQNQVDDWVDYSVQQGVEVGVQASLRAYASAPLLAPYRFLDAYLEPNVLHFLAHFNELVSGYFLRQEEAFIVRRPKVLSRDGEGRLHSTTGRCIEYHDGCGLYAWHGVEVPERVILVPPDDLTRQDFLSEPNVEVRRVIQERMGERFVSELGGEVLDEGPRGTLYAVFLPEDDPEGVALYVQVQDASTPRRYFLRVPPTVQTAEEAVAWSFQMSAEEYRPAHET